MGLRLTLIEDIAHLQLLDARPVHLIPTVVNPRGGIFAQLLVPEFCSFYPGCQHCSTRRIPCASNTFLNVQVPDRPGHLDLRVCDALKVGDWDLAHFEMHGSRLRRQLLEKRPELRQERKNITRMPLVADRANFEHLNAGHGTVCDSFAHENTSCTQSVLDEGQRDIKRVDYN